MAATMSVCKGGPARWVLLATALLPGTVLADGDPSTLGRRVFTELAQPSCGLCHTLQDAGTTGQIGPDLDTLKPKPEQVAAAVRGGVGIMPAFAESLSEEEINAVARYVAGVTGGD